MPYVKPSETRFKKREKEKKRTARVGKQGCPAVSRDKVSVFPHKCRHLIPLGMDDLERGMELGVDKGRRTVT